MSTRAHHRRQVRCALRACALLFGLAAGARAQVVTGQGVVTIGLDGSAGAPAATMGTYNVKANASDTNTDAGVALVAALGDIGLSSGGEIWFLPGTYVFATSVAIVEPGITIRGPRGAVLASAPGLAEPVLDVTADDFTLSSLTFELRTDAGASALRVLGHRARVEECTFAVDPASAGATGVTLVDFVSPAGPSRGGPVVRGNTFHFATGALAADVVGLSATGGAGARILENTFGGGDAEELSRSAIVLQNVSGAVLHANSFERLGSDLGGERRLLAATSVVALVAADNRFERCRYDVLFHLEGGPLSDGPFAVTGNVIGNTFDDGTELGRGALSSDVGGLVFAGNSLRGMGGSSVGGRPRAALRLAGDGGTGDSHGVVVASNQFARCRATQMESQIEAGAVHVFGNQFSADTQAFPPDVAVDLPIGGGHMLYANAAFGAWACPPWSVADVATSQVGLDDNWSSGGVCGPGSPLSCSGPPCPCGNDPSAVGQGCRSSIGVGITIEGSGTASYSADDLVLIARNLPPNNSGLFIVGLQSPSPGFNVFDGVMCIGGDTRRFQGLLQNTGVSSDDEFVAQEAAISGVYFSAGATYYFQFYSRDSTVASPCGGFANLSPLYVVTMAP